MTDTTQNIAAVLGGGSFGTAIASILAANGFDTRLWVRDPETVAAINQHGENPRYLPGQTLPDGVTATDSLEQALAAAELIFVALPSRALAEVLPQASPLVKEGSLVVSCTKGIHGDGFLLMSELVKQHWPQCRIGVLSGPNLAKEIVEQQFTGTVIASEDEALCARVQQALSCGYFRVYANPDRYGVELAGALKNIYAIATGIASALGVGENSKAFLITRSLAEMSRFAVCLGANPLTFLGLAGVGDLIVTCSSNLSRNFRVGYAIGQGDSVEQAVAALGQTAEGINTVKLVAEKSRELDVYMPIAAGLYGILFEQQPMDKTVASLMGGHHTHDVSFTVL